MRKILLALILLCSTVATAQTVSLAPVPKQIFFGTTGSFIDKPLAGGKIYTYSSGTMTPLATYNSATGLSANPNPVILDSAGFANLWLSNTATYRFVVFDTNGVQQWLVDGITAGGGGGGGAALPGIFGDIILSNGTGQAVVDSGNIVGDPVTDTIFALNGFKSGSPTPSGCNGVVGGSGCATFGLGTDAGTPTSGECILQGFSSDNTLKQSCNGGPFVTIGSGSGSIAGVLGQPTYGVSTTAAQSLATELAADAFPGANICAKIGAAIAALPANGGIIKLSAQNYGVCSGSLATTTPNITLRGAGMGNFASGNCATTINFPVGAGLSGSGQGFTVEDMCIKSVATTLGTGDGLTFAGPSPKCSRVVVKGFSRDGIVVNDNTDFWEFTACYSDSNKRDGYRFTAGCSDENGGTARGLSSTANGGVGYDILCGVSNTWIFTHASNNAGGNYVLNTSYNTFIAYSELGLGSSFIIGPGNGYNHIFFYAFGQPTVITDNGVPQTNEIHADLFGGTDGQYPVQNTFSLTGDFAASPLPFYSWIVGGGSYGAQEMIIRDRLNTTNIYSYVPAVGHTFLKPVFLGLDNSVAGQLGISNGSVLAHTLIKTQATSNWTFSFPINAGTAGQCLTTDGSGNGIWATCGTGGGGSAAGPAGTVQGSDGAGNFTALAAIDNGTTFTFSEPVNTTQLQVGSSLPVSCGAASGIWCTKGGATAGSPTAGEAYIRYDTVTNIFKKSENGGAETTLGGGTVTNFTAGNLSPLFTTTVATASTTPALTFNQSTFAAHKWYGNNTGSTAAPGAQSPACADLSDAGAFCNGTAAASLSVGALANGMTATTQTVGDNTTKVATDAFVIANVAAGVGTGFNNGAGTGYQDAAAISAPSNPGGGCRLYIDSGTGNLSGKKSSGASCMPAAGAASWTTITGGDNSSEAFGVRSGASFLVNYNAASLASPLTGTTFQEGNADGTVTRHELDSFASPSYFTGARANTTAASPSSLAANDVITAFNAWGHNGTSVVGPQAAISQYASQNWSLTHLGTYMKFFTTPNNSTTITEAGTIENDGGLTWPSTVTGGSKGAGSGNFTSLYVGGVAVSAPTAVTYYNMFNAGGSAVTFTAVSNTIRGSMFVVTAPVTFSNIYIGIQTTEAANPVYGAAIINVGTSNGGFGTSGSAVCHNTSGVQLGTVNTMTAFPCSEGSVTLQPGNYALLTTGSSTVGKYIGSIAWTTFWYNGNVVGCTATSGVISFSSPCTVSFTTTTGGVMPNSFLH